MATIQIFYCLKQQITKTSTSKSITDRDDTNINHVHKYLDQTSFENKFCESTLNTTLGYGYHIHKDRPIPLSWFDEPQQLHKKNKEVISFFDSILSHEELEGTCDVPVGSSEKEVSKINPLPPKEEDAFSIFYPQENYKTCGICAVVSAFHALGYIDLAKLIILKKRIY